MAVLDKKVTEDPVNSEDRSTIIRGLWSRVSRSAMWPPEAKSWDAYFYYYTAECKKAVDYQNGEHTTIRKHRDVLAIANELENNDTKEEIKERLRLLDTQQRNDTIRSQMAEGSLRLVVRLISMVDTGPIPHDRIQGRAPLIWDMEHCSLKTFLGTHFVESTSDHRNTKFEDGFTAFNFRRFLGLEIQWTNNLADHLRLIENDTKLCIFHHAKFLSWQNSEIFPDGLMEETLQTLALLFPRYDKNTRKWLKKELSIINNAVYIDSALLNCNRLMPNDRRAENFKFWRDELMTLKDLFDQPRPSSIIQFWYDRRNKPQWYTFWIAVMILCLTIFFGIAQTILGALQVYKAYNPTRDQYPY